MPYVLTCSICGRGTDVEQFEVSARLNRFKTTVRVGAGGIDLCSVCWTKYCLPRALGLKNWDDLMARQVKRLEATHATDLPIPHRRVNHRPDKANA